MLRPCLAIFILIAGTWYWYRRSHVPAVASVNGVYRNPCCGDVVLQDGVIITGKVRVPFKLENMKFGLTAYTDKELRVQGTQVVVRTSEEEGNVSFNKEGTVFVLCGPSPCHPEYLFKRR